MLISQSCWCDLTGHQISLYVEHMACLLLVPCALLSIVGLLPSCYPSIVSVAPHVSPSLPSFVSLYSLLVSVVLCWSVVFRCVRVMLTANSYLHACLPVFPLQGGFCSSLLLITRFPCIWVLAISLLTHPDSLVVETCVLKVWSHFTLTSNSRN